MSQIPPGPRLLGLHHVTALAGDPWRNLDFYGRIAGMRLVKRTVNFDDPASYHFYFGAGNGAPGTLLTFFPWATPAHPKGRPGARGSGQITRVRMRVPEGAGSLEDPDGIAIEFVGGESPRLQSVTLRERDAGPTLAFFRDVLGLDSIAPDRLALDDGAWIEVEYAPDSPRGKMGAGVVHHVAFRVADEEAQLEWREKLLRAGLRVSAVRDRLYFHSIYFREPGGVLLEIATDGPGFLIDETEERLGERICLPPWLEPSRESIERRLPR
jgi:glyoxalase family protein